MSADPVRVARRSLEASVAGLLVATGVSADDAAITACDLVAADAEGLASHGVMLVPMYVDRLRAGSVSTQSHFEIIRQTNAAIVADAHNSLGQTTARRAVEEAVAVAQKNGLGAVAVRNVFHMGALGLYARLMADRGCIGLVTANTRPLLPAPGSSKATTGNNPLAIAAPSSGPFHATADLALSAAAMGKIRNAAAADQPIPEGWATDAQGRPTTDAQAAIAGMLLPAGGPKGFALALLLDLIAGGLSEGGIGAEVAGLYGDPAVAYNSSAFFIAIHVGHFTDLDSFGHRTSETLERIASAPGAPGAPPVRAPGARSAQARSSASGSVPIAPAAYKALQALIAEMAPNMQALKPLE